ncbi:MAG: phosphoribosylamine--glycine ligase [Thermoplasmatota archaeon]
MSEKVLLVGGGAREHAIAEALAKSGARVFAALKNRNPGILRLAAEHALVGETDAAKIAELAAKWGVTFAVLGMDAAIEAGVGDALAKVGVKVASPTRAAGEIEWNKRFARDLFEKHAVPGRIRYKVFDAVAGVGEFIDACGGAVAVKPLGLTGGKGVKVTGDQLPTRDAALAYAREVLANGPVLVEEKVEGEEFSLQLFCDGKRAAPMPPVQDHKRAFEGDLGPNTGGMGSYSDADASLPFLPRADLEESQRIAQKMLDALAAEGRPYCGTMYAQFMLTRDGPRIIEVNARFGDPEAMNVLALLDSSYLAIVAAQAEGTLAPSHVRFARDATVCKYVVPAGYGTKPAANEPLAVDERAIERAGAKAYYAAVNENGGKLTTTTSRAVGVVARGSSLDDAEAKCEAALKFVTGPHLFVRHDIGTRQLVARRVEHMGELRGSR